MNATKKRSDNCTAEDKMLLQELTMRELQLLKTKIRTPIQIAARSLRGRTFSKVGEQQQCPCYTGCPGFHKLAEIKGLGLVVYYHRKDAENTRQEDEEVENDENLSQDIFIFYNKKEVKITTSKFFSELEEENISCPRCRNTFKHAQELMKEVKSIDRNIIMGICDHCTKKSQTIKKPFCVCDKIVKKFKFVDVQKLPRTSLKNRELEEIREDTPSMDAKQELIRRHDLSLRQMMRLDKDSRVPYSDISVYETPKTAPWEQKEIKHLDMDMKPTKTKHDLGTRDLISHKVITSVTQMAKSKSWHKKPLKIPKPQFSFFFPKVQQKGGKKKVRVVPSSQLRKDIQEKLHLQAERENKGPEQRRQQKPVQDQEKKLVREGKTSQADEKTRQAAEDKKSRDEDKTKKDLKPQPQQGDKFDEVLQKTKKDKTEMLEKTKEDVKKKSAPAKEGEKNDLKEKPKQKSMDDDLMIMKAKKAQKEQQRDEKKNLKHKPQQEDKIDEVLQKTKKNRSKPEEEKTGKILQETKKDKIEVLEETKEAVKEKSTPAEKGEKNYLKEKPKRKSMDDDLMNMKARKALKEQQRDENKNLKHKPQQEDKIDEVLQKTKKNRSKPEEEKTGKILQETKKDKIKVLEKTKEAVMEKSTPAEKGEKNNLKENPKRKSIDDDLMIMKALKAQKNTKEKGKQSEQQILESISLKTRTEQNNKISEVNKVEATSKQKHQDPKKEQKDQDPKKEQKEKAAKAIAEKVKLLEQLKKEKQNERAKESVKLKIGDVKLVTGTSMDNLILKLIQIKNDTMKMTTHEYCNHELGYKTSSCPLCLYSDLELDVLSMTNRIHTPVAIVTDIIKGEKILKLQRFEKTKEPEVDPKYSKVFFPVTTQPPKEIVQTTEQAEKINPFSIMKAGKVEVESCKGILRYALSDRTFIEKGWTMLPTEKVVRKMNVYRMRPAHPEFDWFEHNKNKRLMTYDTGEKLAEFDDNGRGRWYYRNGRLALDYYDAEETNAQQRFVIYSSGEPDERGRSHPITILATFDYLGNGIVFDHAGKIRLKYNQTEGVVLDRGIGPVSQWKWHTLNDPPVLQQVMIDTQMAYKDPNIIKLGPSAEKKVQRSDNEEEMLAIEFDNFIREKSKKLSQKFKPFQIKMKALKINEHFSLRVLDQATVYLIFRDGSTNLKLNIGMILDHHEIVDTDTAEVGEVSNSLERFPARTDSLAGLQRSVAYAQRYEKLRSNRERRLLRPAEPCASADHLTAAASPPMRLPFRTVPTGSSSTTGRCSGYCSRKPINNLYYDARLYE